MWANYFHLTATSDSDLHRYAIVITPEAKGKKAKRVIELLLSSSTFSDANVATDYRSTLISRDALEQESLDNAVIYMFEDEDVPRPNATAYRVGLLDTGTLSVSELMKELASTDPNDAYGNKLDTIQALNIILNHYPKTRPDTANPRQNKFFPFGKGATSFDLGAGLQALRGYYSSVRAATSRVLVNVNVSQAVFYESIALDAMITKFANAYGECFQSCFQPCHLGHDCITKSVVLIEDSQQVLTFRNSPVFSDVYAFALRTSRGSRTKPDSQFPA